MKGGRKNLKQMCVEEGLVSGRMKNSERHGATTGLMVPFSAGWHGGFVSILTFTLPTVLYVLIKARGAVETKHWLRKMVPHCELR